MLGRKVIDSENLLSTGDDFADAAERGQTEPFRQLQVGDIALVDALADDE
jgi:hypothetical protein